MIPTRIRLSRAKGWRLPEGAVIVARPTPWGNPFVVGTHGTAAECVEFYAAFLAGLWAITLIDRAVFERDRAYVIANMRRLRGKPLACWCALDRPCHANALLLAANAPEGQPATPDMMSWSLHGLAL